MRLKSIIVIALIISSSFVLYNNFYSDKNLVSGAAVLYAGPNSTYKTIQAAVNAANSGDTIYVENGTYFESVLVDKSDIDIIGNSTTYCNITHQYTGSHPLFDYATAFNVTGSDVNITGFNISVSGAFTYGIFLNISTPDTNIINNKITTSGTACFGIVSFNSNFNTIEENTIATDGLGAGGILLYQSAYNNLINNTITSTGQFGHGIFINDSASYNSLMGNTIQVENSGSRGVLIDQASINNSITNNGFTIIGTGSPCIEINQNSDDTKILDQIITTNGFSEFGMEIISSDNTMVYDSNITTTDAATVPFRLDGQTALLINTDLNAAGNDVVIFNDGNATAVNCSFEAVESSTGVFQVRNYLTVQAYEEEWGVPLVGADVEITDNEVQVYASPGFGGTDSTTDSAGIVGPIIVSDRWFVYSNTARINATNVTVSKTVDASWSGIKPDVNMSTSHTEYFIGPDITAPAEPTNFTVEQISGQNKMNLSWTLSIDEVAHYSIVSNRSGSWTLLQNVTNVTSYYTDEFNFIHGMTYYYAVGAVDDADIDNFTNIGSAVFVDDVPPQTPNGLSITPVINGDALNISWFPNLDDTQIYSIYSNRTGDWKILQNVSYQNTHYFDNHDLVNGTRYYYKLSAWDEVPLQSPLSPAASTVHIDQIKPSAPADLKAVNATGTSIELTWTQGPELDIQGYIIYVNITGAGSGGPFNNITIIEGAVNSYVVSNLTEETTYYFKIKAFDEVPNLSEFSNVAGNTTIDSTPPEAPDVAPLPEFTNETVLIVHGTTEPNATVRIIRNGGSVGESSADDTGKFDKIITLTEGENAIAVYAIDTVNNQGPLSEVQTVVLDTVKPTANGGPDFLEPGNSIIVFNASRSNDEDSGLSNFTWIFTYNNESNRVYGELVSFIFETSGNYTVTLRVADFAGNWDEDVLWVNITTAWLDRTPPAVLIDKLYPPVDGENIEVRLTLEIPFNEHVNISTFSINLSAELNLSGNSNNGARAITYDIIPGVPKYDEENKTVLFVTQRDLIYNTTYFANFTIADLTNNGLRFGWSFTTMPKPIIPPDTTPPKPDFEQFLIKNAGLPVDEQITIPFDEDLNEESISISVTDGSGEEVAGDWVYDAETQTIVFTPDEPLKFNEQYTVTFYVEDTSGNPILPEDDTLTFTTEAEDKDDELSPLLVWAMLAVIFVVIILIVIVLFMQRKTRKEFEEMEEEEE